MAKKREKVEVKAGIIVGIVFIVVAFIIWQAPLMQVPYTVMVDYEDTETYYEDEPYQATETYIEQVPLDFSSDGYVRTETMEEHQQIIIGDIVIQDEIVEVEFDVAKVDVMNIDDVVGDFVVSFSGFTPMFGEISLTRTLTLDPGELETAECPAESSIDDWDYEVAPDTKGVEKERTVTKYERVEKQRTVTKQRPETRYKRVPILDYLLYY
jgi:hypothetical protein